MIVGYLFTAGIVLASLIIQSHSSFDALRIAGIKPDLVLIAVVYCGYSFGSFYGEVTGFIAGLFHDSISNSPLGLLTFPKMAIGFISGMFGRAMFKESIFTISLLIFLASLAKGIMTLLLSFLFHEATLSAIAGIILPESFYNAVIASPLFFLFDKIFEKELQREGH